MEAKGHCWRFSPEGKSTANGVIINVWRFEFLSPATPPLCPESSDYSSRTEHTFTPIKVSTENFKNVNHFTKTVLSSFKKCFYLVVWPCTAKLRTNLWQIVLGKLTGPLCLLILLAPPPSALIGTARIIMFITVCKAHLKNTFLRKYVFWGII